jgi:hypothetical protein
MRVPPLMDVRSGKMPNDSLTAKINLLVLYTGMK